MHKKKPKFDNLNSKKNGKKPQTIPYMKTQHKFSTKFTC